MCPGKVDESPICPGNPSYTFPGLKTSHKDGTQRIASSQVLSLLWVSVIDLESPVVESG